MHGAPAYGEDTRPEVKMKRHACRSNVRKASLGDVGRPNGPQADPFRSPWAALAAKAAKELVQEAERNGTGTRAKRYAQCHFVDIGALKRFVLGQVRCVFYNFAKTTSSCVNIKQ